MSERFLKIGRLVKTGRFPLSRGSCVFGVFVAEVAQFFSLGSMVVEFRVQGLR